METSGSERCCLLEEDHATGAAEFVADLDCFVLPVAKTEKLETLQTAWTSEACLVSSAFDRLGTRSRSASPK